MDSNEMVDESQGNNSKVETSQEESKGRPGSLLSSTLANVFCETSEDSFSVFNINSEVNTSTPMPVRNEQLAVPNVETKSNGKVNTNEEGKTSGVTEISEGFFQNLFQSICLKMQEASEKNKNDLFFKIEETANSLDLKIEKTANNLNVTIEGNKVQSEKNYNDIKRTYNKIQMSIAESNRRCDKNSKDINISIEGVSKELQGVRKEMESNRNKVEEVEDMMKGITHNVEKMETSMQAFSSDIDIVKERIMNTEEQVKDELKRVIVDINLVAKELEGEKDTVQTKLDELKVNMVGDFQKIRQDLNCTLSIGQDNIMEKLGRDIKCTLAMDKAEQENKIRKLSEEVLRKFQELTISQGSSTGTEVQQDIFILQNAVQSMQVKLNESVQEINQPPKLNKYRSNETLASDNEANPPKKRGRIDYETQRSRDSQTHQKYYDNDRRAAQRQNIFYDRSQSPDTYDCYTNEDLDEVEKRESARMSRHIKQENAPSFNGFNTTAPQFIADAEAFFKSVDVRHDKVKLRSLLTFLKQSPLDWWKMTLNHTKSWESFKEQFLVQYFGEYEIQKMEAEWMTLTCKSHWNVEKFALRALKLQEILRGNLDIDRQCHNVIQKLPLVLRDYLSLLKFKSGTDFMKRLKEAMRVKDYDIPTKYNASQKDDISKGRDREREERDQNNKRYNNKPKRAYYKRPYYRGGQNGYYSDNDSFYNDRKYSNDGKYNRRYGNVNNRYKDRGYNNDREDRDWYKDRGYNSNRDNRNRYKDREYNNDRDNRDWYKDREYNNDRDNRDRYKDRGYNSDRDNRDRYRDSKKDNRNDKDKRDGSSDMRDHSRKFAYRDKKDPNQPKQRLLKGRGIRALEAEDYMDDDGESDTQVKEN